MKLSEKLQYAYDCGKSYNGITVGTTTMLMWIEDAKSIENDSDKNSVIDGIIESRQSPIPKEKWGVHRTHCCSKHGCKYGNKYCPVATGELKQDYPCEECQYGDSL